MTAPVRRKTARERDRELIAATRWFVVEDATYKYMTVWNDADPGRDDNSAANAAARELNRIAKEARRADK